MATRAADEFDFIRARRVQIAQHEGGGSAERCGCPYDVREDGIAIKAHQPGCSHYVAPVLSVTMIERPSSNSEHSSEDDWNHIKAAFAAEAVTQRFRRLRWL